MTILATATAVARALKIPVSIEFRPLPEDDPARRRPDIRRARKYLHWTPKTPFGAGLLPTAEYFRSLGIARGRRR